MNDLARDLQYGIRMLWKSKGFTLVAVLSLALGIGFNTTIFSAVDALLLRPKAGSRLESLVEVYLSDSSGYPYSASSYPDFRDYRDRTDVFSDVASYQTTIARYQTKGSSEYLLGEIVSGNLFQLLEAASLTESVPLGASISTENVAPEGREPEKYGDWPEIDSATISPGYFLSMGVPLIQGRDFDWRDRKDSPEVAIVNETAARRLWPGENPLGRRLATGTGTSRKYSEVIAVARDTKVRTLGEDPRPQIFLPFAQDYSPMMFVLARTRGNPDAALESVRRELLSLDSSLAFFEARTMRENLAITLFPVRVGAVLLGVFGGLALLLASVGLYGAVSYSVSRRTREIGIRMALGAARRDVVTLVTRRGVGLVLVGVALGSAVAAAGTRVLASVLYGVGTTDAGIFVGTAVLLVAVSWIANWIPARRASRIHPVTALRYE